MRIAVVFDTPYSGWGHPDHEGEMEKDSAAWKTDEPHMEDLQYLVRSLDDWKPDLVFNGAEAFKGNEALEFSYGHDMANAAAKAGMEYCDFIQRIVDPAIARYERS